MSAIIGNLSKRPVTAWVSKACQNVFKNLGLEQMREGLLYGKVVAKCIVWEYISVDN